MDPRTQPAEKRPPRERMVYNAVQLIRMQGVSGTGLRDVVARAQAPRGQAGCPEVSSAPASGHHRARPHIGSAEVLFHN
jgi:hypothetical protein